MTDPDEPTPESDKPRRSGLRNPQGAVRGMGATVLILESIVLLLAIAPLRMLGGPKAGPGIVAMVALAILGLALIGFLRHPWAWHAVTCWQVMITLAGLFHPMIAIMGVIFLATWLYILHVRRSILG